MSLHLIVGLGNPGRQYHLTRHNVGFLCVDALAKHWGLEFRRQRARAEVAEGDVIGRRVILAKPQTYMNDSGDSVRALARLSNLSPDQILVICDDLDIPFGRLRLREKGGSGGQRGLRSIINQLATEEFPRLRIGIGRPPAGVDPVDYVLTTFSTFEQSELGGMFERAIVGITAWLDQGLPAAMNLVNVPATPPARPEVNQQ